MKRIYGYFFSMSGKNLLACFQGNNPVYQVVIIENIVKYWDARLCHLNNNLLTVVFALAWPYICSV